MRKKYSVRTSISAAAVGLLVALVVVCFLPSSNTVRENSVRQLQQRLADKLFFVAHYPAPGQKENADNFDCLSLQIQGLNLAQRAFDHCGILFLAAGAAPLFLLGMNRLLTYISTGAGKGYKFLLLPTSVQFCNFGYPLSLPLWTLGRSYGARRRR